MFKSLAVRSALLVPNGVCALRWRRDDRFSSFPSIPLYNLSPTRPDVRTSIASEARLLRHQARAPLLPLGASPSKKSVQWLKTTVCNLLVPGNNDPWWEVRDTLNRSLRGWSNYFSYGTRRSAFRGVDRYVYERVCDFLARRHKVAGHGTRRFSCDVVYGERGLLRLERLPLTAPPCGLR